MRQNDLQGLLRGQMRAVGLDNWESEYQFHPSRKWRFDLAAVLPKIAIEVDGGTWANGRHTRGSGYEQDCEKINEAVLLGWRVLRVTGDMVKDGRALALVERAVSSFARA